MTTTVDPARVIACLKHVLRPGDVFEIRALKCHAKRGKPFTAAGWFDDFQRASDEAARIDVNHAPQGIYVTLNPVHRDLLARQKPNSMVEYAEGLTTDSDILTRRWLLIDLDPCRRSGISSTEPELKGAVELARTMREFLESEYAWPEPIRAYSGNGCHLLYPIELANDEEATQILKRTLAGLKFRFATDLVDVDDKVFNASRITKLYGTIARKGADSAERPHRESSVYRAPAIFTPLKPEQLKAIADLAPRASAQGARVRRARADELPPQVDLEERVRRASQYLAKVPGAIEGSDGSGQTFSAAVALVVGFALPEDVALDLLMLEYNPRCEPPWAEKDLRHKVSDASKNPRKPIGHLLSARTTRSTERSKSQSPTPPSSQESAPVDSPKIQPEVLIPGSHFHPSGRYTEIGTDDFARSVLEAIPDEVLYRWDFIVGRIAGEPGDRRFVRLTDHDMRIVVDEAARLTKISAGEEGETVHLFETCSRDLAALVLAAAGTSQRVRELKMFVRHPVYQPDFKLVEPGWNDSSGIFYDEPPALVGVRPRPETATAVLNDLVVDFPFKDAASKENIFGAMLTVLLRPAIEACVPLTLVMASLERTGKGKLINSAIGNAILGRGVQVLQLGSSEEEREKRITSLIITGCTAIHLDNLPIGVLLDSAALASLATAYPTWSGRVLGVSRTPDLPNRLIVMMSGNNPKATGEIAKRIVPVVLQPSDDHPEDRSGFVHADAEGYALSLRREVVEALVGLVEKWKAAGCPPPPPISMGGFERWVAAVGGVLAHAGFTNWMGNYKAWVRMSDEVSADAETLIKAWAAKHGVNSVSASQVLELVKATDTFPFVLARKTEGQLVALARRVLTPLIDRPVAGWLVVRDGSGSSSRYRLSKSILTASPGVSGDSGVSTARMTHASVESPVQPRRDTPETPGTPANTSEDSSR